MAAGKVCLVLGAGEKLGFAVARKYAQSGFKGIVKPIQLIKGRRHFYITLLVYDVVKFSKSFLSSLKINLCKLGLTTIDVSCKKNLVNKNPIMLWIELKQSHNVCRPNLIITKICSFGI